MVISARLITYQPGNSATNPIGKHRKDTAAREALDWRSVGETNTEGSNPSSKILDVHNDQPGFIGPPDRLNKGRVAVNACPAAHLR
jgi:hypothetical protein